MNVVQGPYANQAHKFAAELDRRTEELKFLEEMLYNVSIEISTYQNEINSLQPSSNDASSTSSSAVSKVMEKLFKKKPPETIQPFGT